MHRKLSRALFYTLIALLVLLALLLSALRVTVTHVADYRQQAERLASDYLGQPVRIAGLDARMVGTSPSLVLEGLTLFDSSGEQPLAGFSHLALGLDLFASLWQLQPVVRVVLGGAEITVQRQADGQLSVQGLPTGTTAGDSDDELLRWLEGIPRLVIRDSHIHWQDRPDGEFWHFQVRQLRMENRPGWHRLRGNLGLPGALGERLEVALQLDGDPLDPTSWDLDFYLKLQQLQAAARAGHYRYQEWQLEQATLDLELWGRWQGQHLTRLEGSFDLADLRLSSTQHPEQHITRLASQLRYQHDNTTRLELQQLRLQHGEHTWQPMRISVMHQDDRLSIRADQLELGQLRPLAPLLPWLDAAQQEQLHALAPEGRIEALHLQFAGQQLQQAGLRLEGLGIQPWQQWPGIEGLNAQLEYHEGQAQVSLDSPALRLSLPGLFRQPLALHHSRGQLQLARQEDGWRLLGRELTVDSPDVQLQLAFEALFDGEGSPLVSLQGQFDNAQATAVRDYLPVAIMPDSAVSWLDRAFLTGRAKNGQLLLHGRLADFPFRQSQGHFEVVFEGHDVSLNYDPDWPVLHDIFGEVRFINTAMQVRARQGRAFRGRIGTTEVEVSDFGRALLQIRGSASASAEDGLRFLLESPLGRGLGVLSDFQVDGNARLQLQLALPLSRRVAADARRITGQLQLDDARLQINEALVFEAINGQLEFDEDRFRGNGIEATLFEHPLKIDVQHREASRETLLLAQGNTDAEALHHHWPQPLLQHLQGQFAWQGQLLIPHQGERPVKLFLSSDGVGLHSALPHPLNKQADVLMPLTLSLQLAHADAQANTLRIGDRLAARWQPAVDGPGLTRAAVQFGSPIPPPLPEQPAIALGGELERLDLAAWRRLGSGSGSGTTALPLQIDMQRLHLLAVQPAEETDQQSPPSAFQQAVTVHIRRFGYQELELGEARLRLHPTAEQLVIDALYLQGTSFTLSGQGHASPATGTELTLQLDSDNLGNMLTGLGFASVIRDGRARASGALHWLGAPSDLSLLALTGTVSVEIQDGTFEEARPGAGKLLGILSLQALPRRLRMDFSDIAESGLQFRQIRGELEFSQGNAITRELHIDTHPAQILLSGRTGLLAQDFDHEMSVIPEVSGTVSVAGALAWGPQVGAALILLQSLFKRDIDAATMKRYRITGSWDEPEITPLTTAPAATPDHPWQP